MLYIELGKDMRKLGKPVSCSRIVRPGTSSLPQAFGLPKIQVNPVRLDGFIGDVEQGGSCNVNILEFTAHNLTHVETARHLISEGLSLKDLPVSVFNGICFLIDLSDEILDDGYIYPKHLELLQDYPEATIVAIKSTYSDRSPDIDFTGTDPISLHPSTTKLLTESFPRIKLLVLDLPSADKEDNAALSAHRNFFDIDSTGSGKEKAIIELAYFNSISETGYYYLQCTPARIDVDAIITDVIIYDVL